MNVALPEGTARFSMETGAPALLAGADPDPDFTLRLPAGAVRADAKAAAGEEVNGSSPMLTNVGAIDAERVAFGAGEKVSGMRWYSPFSPAYGVLAAGAASFRDRLEVCMGYVPSKIDPDAPQRIVAGVVAELGSWAGEFAAADAGWEAEAATALA